MKGSVGAAIIVIVQKSCVEVVFLLLRMVKSGLKASILLHFLFGIVTIPIHKCVILCRIVSYSRICRA